MGGMAARKESVYDSRAVGGTGVNRCYVDL